MSDDSFKGPGPEKEAPKPVRGRAGREAKGNDADPAAKRSVPALTASDSPAPAPDRPKPAPLDDDALTADGAMRFGLDGAAIEPVSAEHRAGAIAVQIDRRERAQARMEFNMRSTIDVA